MEKDKFLTSALIAEAIEENRLRLTIPLSEIDELAQGQLAQALKMGCVKAIAVMPDIHAGYDLPIGSVALLEGYIWPGAVGYDIGCGMSHLNLGSIDLDDPWQLRNDIMDVVLVGFNQHKTKQTVTAKFPNASKYTALADAVNYRASRQLGTLGGGNHFIEVGVNSRNEVGITIHSGSRRPGYNIADFYMRQTNGPVPAHSEIGQAYQRDMLWAEGFARLNRKIMMQRILRAMGYGLSHERRLMPNMINESHNHAVFTDEGILHRKGATPAKFGQLGIIPANMRDGVWITKGLGAKRWFSSASHGAGRKMSRTQAKKTLDTRDIIREMEGIAAPEASKIIDESAGAYKSIDTVLARQEGLLVAIEDHFRPLAVVKGT